MQTVGHNLTSQQMRGQVGRQRADEQPVALGRRRALLVALRAAEALIECARPRPAPRRDTESRAGWPPAGVTDPGAVRSIGVPEARNPSLSVARWEVGAGISPSSAIERRGALLGPHAVSMVGGGSVCLRFGRTHPRRMATEFSRTVSNKGNKGEAIQHLKVSPCVKCALSQA